MDDLINGIIDFVRVRQLNIAVAGLLSIVYLVYQYWGVLNKGRENGDDAVLCKHTPRLSRSRSRSSSRSRSRSGCNYKVMDSKRRGRKSYKR